jgi:hypothetical protein
MLKKDFKRIVRPSTAAERKRHAEIRAKVMQEFPPKDPRLITKPVVAVRLEPNEARILKGIAKSKGVKDADIVHDWIREKIKAS